MNTMRYIGVLMLCVFSMHVSAERIKDIASIQGVRSNPLIGYGLVVGLDGTGEKEAYTQQTFNNMLKQFGIELPAGTAPKSKNVAAVAIHAVLEPFAKPGSQIDVTVSSIGSAKSLRGGTLLMTPLKGIDGRIYAIAQGNLVVGGLGVEGADGSRLSINVPTVGRVPNGAMVERVVPNALNQGDSIVFNLHRPDFTTAKRMSDSINNLLGQGTALPVDAASVRVMAPRDPAQRVMYLATVENLTLQSGEGPAKVVVNSRTGTIVIGQHVKVLPAAVTHGSLTVSITEDFNTSQPQAFSNGNTTVTPDSGINVQQQKAKMFKFNPGVSLDDIVKAVNSVGASPGDLMAILEALKQAGALQAELVVI